MGAVAPTLFGAIKLLVNNQTAISEAPSLLTLVPSSTCSGRNQGNFDYLVQMRRRHSLVGNWLGIQMPYATRLLPS